MLNTVQSGSYDLYRDSVFLHKNCLVSRYQLELFANKLIFFFITLNTFMQ